MKDTLTPAPASYEQVISVLDNGRGNNLSKQEQEDYLIAFNKFKNNVSMTKPEIADVCRLTAHLSYTNNQLQERSGMNDFTAYSVKMMLDEILAT